MKFLLVLAAIVAATAAQAPKPCVTPPEWEAREMRMRHPHHQTTFAKISYDAINQRIRRVEAIMPSFKHEREFFDELFIFKEKKGYRMNLKTKECKVFDLKESFHAAQVPYNATSFGEAYVGTNALEREGVLVTLWGGKTPRGHEFFGAVTHPDCIPVAYGFRDKTKRRGHHTTLFDVTLGISDPNVFIPPRECEQ